MVKDTEKGLTSAEFAREIGKDTGTVSRWKSGKLKMPDAIAAYWEYRESDQRWHQKVHN
jgi:transcriptional regulator with XRE-family HTH domain